MAIETSRADPLVHLLGIILERKLLITVGFLCVFGIAIFGAIKMPNFYEAHTKIFVNRPTLPEKLQAPHLGEIGSKAFYSNQKEIIESSLILRKVVLELNLDKKSPPKTFMQIAKSKISNLMRKSSIEIDPVEAAITDLRNYLNIDFVRGTNILAIGAYSQTATGAADLANTVAETYIEYANKSLFKKTQGAYNYIKQELDKAHYELEESERALNNFKKRKKIYSINEQIATITGQISETEEKSQNVDIEIALLSQEIRDRQSDNKPEVLLSESESSISPKLKEINDQLKKLNDELIEARSELTENHPDIKILNIKIQKFEEKRDREKAKANEPIQTINQDTPPVSPDLIAQKQNLKQLLIKKNNLLAQKESLVQNRHELNANSVTLDKLRREFDNNQRTYLMLREKFGDARLLSTDENDQGSITILERAQPPLRGLWRQKLILIATGMVAGLLFGLGMAMIAEYADNTLKTPEMAEEYLELPVLGNIPSVNRKMSKV